MNAIKINYSAGDDERFGQSKWWGQADMPDDLEYPFIPFEDGDDDPMTLVCQIRCADLAPLDTDNLLPHEGMLYFFADIDRYVGALHNDEEDFYEEDPYHNGMGEWAPEAFKVLYSPTEEGLHTHGITDSEGKPYGLPAERLDFEACEHATTLETKLLGLPFEVEVQQAYPDYINLLQVWEEDRWSFFMYDCGILNFLIKPEDLKARRFDRTIVYLHSC